MRLIIVHLSDIHFRHDQENACFKLLDQQVAAIRSVANHAYGIFIAITGDIAFSGHQRQYEIALDYLTRLCDAVRIHTNITPRVVLVPGNHDCDFSDEADFRELLLNNFDPEAAVRWDSLRQMTLQNNFADFSALLNSAPDSSCVSEESGRYIEILSYLCGDVRVDFHLINSAWSSQQREKPGMLLFPLPLLDEARQKAEPASIAISLIHHPLGWFRPAVARKLQKYIQSSVDIALSGHEHEPGGYARIGRDRSHAEYLEGGVLQEYGDDSLSSFNVLEIDVEKNHFRMVQFDFSSEDARYNSSGRDDWRGFIRNASRVKKEFEFSVRTVEHLRDAGANFSHPYCAKLYLSDIFVWPDLRSLAATEISDSEPVVISDVMRRVLADRRVFMVGPEKCGKTALSRMIVRSLYDHGIIPVLLDGRLIRDSDVTHLDRLIATVTEEMYSRSSVEQYLQLPKIRRALVIDDFHRSHLNQRGKNRLLTHYLSAFEFIVIFGEQEMLLQDITEAALRSREGDMGPTAILNFKPLEILHFGYAKRSDLVRAWMYLGNDSTTIDEEKIRRKVHRAEQMLSTVIGKNMAPSYPIFILILLQQAESAERLSTASGAHGFLYEALLTQSLTRYSRKETDIDTRYNYLAELANFMEDTSSSPVSRTQLNTWHRKYCDQYMVDLDFERTLVELGGAQILTVRNQEVRFAYPYQRYYFIARYFRDHINETSVRERIASLCGSLYNEESANILIFLSYLSKDKFILDTVLKAAASLFKGAAPHDLSKRHTYLNSIIKVRPRLILEALAPEENRRRELEELDRKELTEHSTSDLEIPEPSEHEEAGVAHLLETNAAFKTIQILGQLLMSFPGSLTGDEKIRIATECYNLGLRVLGVAIGLFEQHGAEIAKWLVEVASRFQPEASKRRLEEEANALVYTLNHRFAIGIIKHISSCVATEELARVFERLLATSDNASYQAIDLSIKLDQYGEFPRAEVLRAYDTFCDDLFASGIIRHLAWHRMYLFPLPSNIKQSVCAKLHIEYRSSSNRNRLLPAGK